MNVKLSSCQPRVQSIEETYHHGFQFLHSNDILLRRGKFAPIKFVRNLVREKFLLGNPFSINSYAIAVGIGMHQALYWDSPSNPRTLRVYVSSNGIVAKSRLNCHHLSPPTIRRSSSGLNQSFRASAARFAEENGMTTGDTAAQ